MHTGRLDWDLGNLSIALWRLVSFEITKKLWHDRPRGLVVSCAVPRSTDLYRISDIIHLQKNSIVMSIMIDHH